MQVPPVPLTYRIVEDGTAIQCMVCGLVSWNPHDVQQRYCGMCHVFHAQLIVLPYEHYVRLLGSVQAAFQHGLDARAMPEGSLHARCRETLLAVMGDEACARWEGSL